MFLLRDFIIFSSLRCRRPFFRGTLTSASDSSSRSLISFSSGGEEVEGCEGCGGLLGLLDFGIVFRCQKEPKKDGKNKKQRFSF